MDSFPTSTKLFSGSYLLGSIGSDDGSQLELAAWLERPGGSFLGYFLVTWGSSGEVS